MIIRLCCVVALIELAVAGRLDAQQVSALAERGQKIYASEKCSVCHSIAGKGNQKGALDGVGTKLSADITRQWIVNAPEMTKKMKATRKPPMKAYAHIPKDDLEALVAYLQSLKKT